MSRGIVHDANFTGEVSMGKRIALSFFFVVLFLYSCANAEIRREEAESSEAPMSEVHTDQSIDDDSYARTDPDFGGKSIREDEVTNTAEGESQIASEMKSGNAKARMDNITGDIAIAREDEKRRDYENQERLAAEKRRIEEEEQRRREEELRAEERRRAEEKLREEKISAIAARNNYIRQQREYALAFEAYVEEKKRREREERIARVDPERMFFFRKDNEKKMPATLYLTIPEGYTLKLYDLRSSLLTHGYPDWTSKNLPLRGSGGVSINLHSGQSQSSSSSGTPVPLKPEEALNIKEGYHLLLLESQKGDERSLLTFNAGGKVYYITGIYTDGYDYVRVDAESAADDIGHVPEFFRWVPRAIVFNEN